MPVVIDATLNGPASNSYQTLADAELIAANIPGGADWIALTEDEKNSSLVAACFWLETLEYRGVVCTDTQRLKWARSGEDCQGRPMTCSEIPYKIREAQVLLAMSYGADPSSFPILGGGGGGAAAGTFVSKQQLGDLVIEYTQYRGDVNTNCDDCEKTPILQTHPWLEAVLGCYINMPAPGSGRIIGRVRS